jgi:starvation-inducible DNA-binding protein
MKVNIGIPEKHLATIALELNKLLADEHVLYVKTRNFHWNIEGENFMEMHKFYESQYEELAEMIDEVAERIRTLGHYAEGRMKDFLEIARLAEVEYTNDQKKQLQFLLDDHETIIRLIRQQATAFADEHKDQGTADFVTGIMEKHEKMAWMIRSYLR